MVNIDENFLKYFYDCRENLFSKTIIYIIKIKLKNDIADT